MDIDGWVRLESRKIYYRSWALSSAAAVASLLSPCSKMVFIGSARRMSSDMPTKVNFKYLWNCGLTSIVKIKFSRYWPINIIFNRKLRSNNFWLADATNEKFLPAGHHHHQQSHSSSDSMVATAGGGVHYTGPSVVGSTRRTDSDKKSIYWSVPSILFGLDKGEFNFRISAQTVPFCPARLLLCPPVLL